MSDCQLLLLNKRRKRIQTPKKSRDKLKKNENYSDTSLLNLENSNAQQHTHSLNNITNVTKEKTKPKRKSIKLRTNIKNKVNHPDINAINFLENIDEGEVDFKNILEDDDDNMNTNFVFSEHSEKMKDNIYDLISNFSFDSAKFSLNGINFLSELQSESTKISDTKNEMSIIQKQEELTISSVYERDIKMCSICLELVNFNDKHYLRCGHIFHQNCITEWLKIKNICPNCKQSSCDELNLLNNNLRLFYEENFTDVFTEEDLIINRNFRENINDITLFLDIINRHKYLFILMLSGFILFFFKLVNCLKSYVDF